MVVFPWLKLNHTDYSIIHFYTEALVRGRLNELAGTDGTAYLLTVFLAFPVMGGICSVIKGILLICKKPIRIITGDVYKRQFLKSTTDKWKIQAIYEKIHARIVVS